MSIILEDKEIKAAYEILKSTKDAGMFTIIFRDQLGDIINEDEEDILLDIEDRLIKDGWVFQDLKSRLLTPTDKLLACYD
ncbi:MAG: hypothetical protein HZC47_10260 [Methanobacterium sp.]|uniref:hypothetical protein n=1 Tax=Methanobacterium sp. TaxID=2164 RepID=UPI003D64CDBF|nr:hypothetical protein [Methanobacterium sp.]